MTRLCARTQKYPRTCCTLALDVLSHNMPKSTGWWMPSPSSHLCVCARLLVRIALRLCFDISFVADHCWRADCCLAMLLFYFIVVCADTSMYIANAMPYFAIASHHHHIVHLVPDPLCISPSPLGDRDDARVVSLTVEMIQFIQMHKWKRQSHRRKRTCIFVFAGASQER